MYEPKHLKLWTMPANYCGAVWPATYSAGFGQHRDSDALERSNFRVALEALRQVSKDVQVVRESHWAVGWVEWIAVDQDDEPALRVADGLAGRMEDYPVLDEEDFSALEQEDANETWRNCYNPRERIAYIRAHRNQFDFRSLADLLGCVRGLYFAGYAGELLS